MMLSEQGDHGFLTRKILMQRANADARSLGNAIDRGFVVAFLDQNVSRCCQNGLDRQLRAVLLRQFTGVVRGLQGIWVEGN